MPDLRSDPAAGFAALLASAVVGERRRDVVTVSGPDAVTYLQGQLSQDVAALAPGSSAWTFVLQPTGRVDAWARVTRVGADEVHLDVDAGHGEAVRARLARFLLRTAARVELVADLRCLTVRGRDAGPAEAALAQLRDAVPPSSLVLDAPALSPDLPGGDLLVSDDVLIPEELVLVGADVLDAVRLLRGLPAAGAELDERTIPGETGLVDVSASFTKGCYTGQELVARVDSRGNNVPRLLRGVRVEGTEPVPAGASISSTSGDTIGVVTSAAPDPRGGAVLALGSIKRGAEVPLDAIVADRAASVLAVPVDL